MNEIEQLVSILFALALGGFAVRWWSGRHPDSVRTPREAVAAAPERAPARVADLIEEVGLLAADMKGLRREWADFDKSWERRWGAVTKANSRADAAAAAAAVESVPADPSQLAFPMAEPGDVAQPARRLVPTRMLRAAGK